LSFFVVWKLKKKTN
jgi:WD40 repeat protein